EVEWIGPLSALELPLFHPGQRGTVEALRQPEQFGSRAGIVGRRAMDGRARGVDAKTAGAVEAAGGAESAVGPERGCERAAQKTGVAQRVLGVGRAFGPRAFRPVGLKAARRGIEHAAQNGGALF